MKFDGGYHGHSDSVLVEAGSGVSTLGLPVPPECQRTSLKKASLSLTMIMKRFNRYSRNEERK